MLLTERSGRDKVLEMEKRRSSREGLRRGGRGTARGPSWGQGEGVGVSTASTWCSWRRDGTTVWQEVLFGGD